MTDHYLKGKIGDNEIRISALCAMTYLYFCRYDLIAFARVFSITTIVAAMCVAGFVVLFTIYTFTDKRNISWDGILIIALAAAFFIITYKLHPEYRYRYLDLEHNGRHSAKTVFSFGSPLFFYYLVRLFKNEEEKMFALLKAVAFSTMCLDIWTLFDRSSADKDYSMGFGYQMEMAAIIFLAVYLYEKKNLYLVFSIAAMMLGVLYGSRACIIGYAVFVVLYFVWDNSITKQKGTIVVLGISAAVIYESKFVVKLIYDFFNSMGLYSRTLYYIARGDILEPDTARQDSIWPSMIVHIKELTPFKMYGAFGDRNLLEDRWVYPHNIFLEVMLTFGLILGSAFFIWMFWQFILVICKNKEIDGLFVIMFGSFSICRLFFSSTIWEEPHFWAFIAMLINCGYKRRMMRYYDDN